MIQMQGILTERIQISVGLNCSLSVTDWLNWAAPSMTLWICVNVKQIRLQHLKGSTDDNY